MANDFQNNFALIMKECLFIICKRMVDETGKTQDAQLFFDAQADVQKLRQKVLSAYNAQFVGRKPNVASIITVEQVAMVIHDWIKEGMSTNAVLAKTHKQILDKVNGKA